MKVILFDLDNTLLTSDNQIGQKARDIIKHFKGKGFKIALCSLNKLAGFELYQHGISSMFDFVVHKKFSDECETEKEKKLNASNTKKHMLCEVCKFFGTQPQDGILFDDNLFHIIEARTIGMPAIHVDGKHGIRWSDVRRATAPALKRSASV